MKKRIFAVTLGLATGAGVTYLGLKEKEKELPRPQPKDFKYGRPVSSVSFHSYSSHSLEYDRARKVPLWVMERLSHEDVKKEITADRHRSLFQPDPNLPPHFSSSNDDYFKSGWSRGHMAAAGNYKHDQDCMDETFYLTNILPQDLENNSNYWYRMESYCRNLLKRNYNLTIISGPLFLPVEVNGIKMVQHQVIGENNVSVPTHLFKIILAERGEGPPLLGSFIIPNEPVPDRPLKSFQVPLETIENYSGTHFLQYLQRHMVLDLCEEDGCKIMSEKVLLLYRYSQQLKEADSKEVLEKVWSEMNSKGIEPDEHARKAYKNKMKELDSEK